VTDADTLVELWAALAEIPSPAGVEFLVGESRRWALCSPMPARAMAAAGVALVAREHRVPGMEWLSC
jgi:hypothetical protein